VSVCTEGALYCAGGGVTRGSEEGSGEEPAPGGGGVPSMLIWESSRTPSSRTPPPGVRVISSIDALSERMFYI